MYSLHIMISENVVDFHLAPGRHRVASYHCDPVQFGSRYPREPLMRLTRRSGDMSR